MVKAINISLRKYLQAFSLSSREKAVCSEERINKKLKEKIHIESHVRMEEPSSSDYRDILTPFAN